MDVTTETMVAVFRRQQAYGLRIVYEPSICATSSRSKRAWTDASYPAVLPVSSAWQRSALVRLLCRLPGFVTAVP
jgi:hypothetical protein